MEIGNLIAQIIGLVALIAGAVIAVSVALACIFDYLDRRSKAKRYEEIVDSLTMVHRWFSGFRDLDIIWDYIYGKRGGSIDSVRHDYAKARGTDVTSRMDELCGVFCELDVDTVITFVYRAFC